MIPIAIGLVIGLFVVGATIVAGELFVCWIKFLRR